MLVVFYHSVIHCDKIEKCRKHSPAAHVAYISLEFSNARRALSQCNTRIRLLYLLNIYRERGRKVSIYNPPNNFCELSLDKADHVIQNRKMDVRGYPSSDFISTEGKPRNKQTFKLNF